MTQTRYSTGGPPITAASLYRMMSTPTLRDLRWAWQVARASEADDPAERARIDHRLMLIALELSARGDDDDPEGVTP
jgi:hypothetical protein